MPDDNDLDYKMLGWRRPAELDNVLSGIPPLLSRHR